MVRMVNLVVEVFIDVDDEGTAHAEAVLLRNADKRLLGTGFATVRRRKGADPVGEGRVAAFALADLAQRLLRGDVGDTGAAGRARPPPAFPARRPPRFPGAPGRRL